MFPSNLHKNIVQLDRQISLLENECKNIEIESKKKNFKSETSCGGSNKISNASLKSPTVKVTVKKTNSSLRCKKPTPTVSTRLQPSKTSQSHCIKTWSEIDNNSVEKKKKQHESNADLPVCSCQLLCSPHFNTKKENKFMKCIYCNEIPESDLANDDNFEKNNKEHVLHKELVFPNSGGAIEVTVTQKSQSGKENLSLSQKPAVRKSINSERKIDNDLNGCKCQIKGQKWSEILCENSCKRKQSYSGNNVKNKILAEETKTAYKPLNVKKNKKQEENFSCEHYNNGIQTVQEESFEVPVKLSSQINKAEMKTEINNNKFEKEIQCALENYFCGEPGKEAKVPGKIFQFLLYICQQIPSEILNKLPCDSETVSKIKEALSEVCGEKKKNACSGINQDNYAYINAVKQHCENLLKEKALLSQELVARDNAVATMRKREEDYASVISSLKLNLEKTKGNAQEGIDAIKELSIIKSKLAEQIQVSEALKKSHIKLQDIMEQCSLENDKLKTQIKIFKLEAKKHEVLLAGKEVEIKRYREEIQNFHRQISDHLAAIKSNAQEIDVEKMIETIVQQSQIFIQTDLEKNLKDSSKTPNALMHSSPTSTKTSFVNSSWKQISSIHDHNQSKANSDIVIYLNDETDGKDFFQIFEENSFSEMKTPKKSKEPSVEKLSLPDKKEIKNSSSFTSCLSVNDDHNSSKSRICDSSVSKGSFVSDVDKSDEQLRKDSQVSLDKAQSNIEELLKNMKLKFSKEIFETSLPSYTTEDFLDISQISSISPL